MSFGVECVGKKPSVYARVPNTDIMQWIREVVDKRADGWNAIYSSDCTQLNAATAEDSGSSPP